MDATELTLKEWVQKNTNPYFFDRIKPHLDKKIVKEFSMSGSDPWASWQEFGREKNVTNWVILEGGVAVGFNENPSIGYGYPVKKLSDEQLQKFMKHTMTYDEYYSNNNDESE